MSCTLAVGVFYVDFIRCYFIDIISPPYYMSHQNHIGMLLVYKLALNIFFKKFNKRQALCPKSNTPLPYSMQKTI